jgi:hypothetical protein
MPTLRSCSSILLILFPSVVVFSQVHIKERLEIKPQQVPPRSPQGIEETTLTTLELIWDAPDDVTLYAETPCGSAQLSESSPGRKVYTIAGSASGRYFFRIFYYGCSVYGQPPAPSANITGTLTFGTDATIVFHESVPPRSVCSGPPNYVEFTYNYSSPNFRLVDFDVVPENSMIWSAEGTTFDFSPYEGCTGGMLWDPAVDPITLTIVSGSDLGEFTVGDDPAPHTTVTVLASELPTVRFIPSGHLRPYGVDIEARCLSIVKTVHLEVRYCSILLGETKYFYAVWVEDDPWLETPYLRICETDSPVLPAGAEASDVWVNREPVYDPVCGCIQPGPPLPPVLNMEYGENAGSRLGVYWEKNGGTGDLPVGMIRFVGRYWHADSVYMVRLIALKLVSYAGGERPFGSSVPIEVKKPTKLGNSHQTTQNVFGEDLNLDEFIINFAGENGIPPQLIKAHIEKETDFKNAFRYEPFEDIYVQKRPRNKVGFMIKRDGSSLPFVVSESGMGGNIPTGHTNVSPTDYERTPQKITEFLEDHLGRYVNTTDVRVIGKELYTRELTEDLKRLHQEVLELRLKGKVAANFAIEVMENRFHWKEYGDDYNNFYAQTRISTSYGMIQMLYATAVTGRFTETDSQYQPANSVFMNRSAGTLPPERLNEIDYSFPRYVDLMLQKLRTTLGDPATIPEYEWNGGFEKVWGSTFQQHNPGEKDYGKVVLSLSQGYLPQ